MWSVVCAHVVCVQQPWLHCSEMPDMWPTESGCLFTGVEKRSEVVPPLAVHCSSPLAIRGPPPLLLASTCGLPAHLSSW